MTAVRKFLFETSFDEIPLLPRAEEPVVDEAEAKEVEEEEVVPTFSEAEVNAARDEGFRRGKEEGIRESSGAIERQISDALKTLDERLTQLFAGQEQSNAANAGNAVTVAMTVVRKIFPHLNRRNALDEVERLVEQSMEKVVNEPRVTITVNAALYDTLNQRLTAIASEAGYEGKVVLRADASIPGEDCRIEWADGGAERDTAAMWQEIDEIIERNLGTGEPALDRTETPPAVTPVDGAETSLDEAEALGAVNSGPESLIIEEADFLAPPAEMDGEPGEPGFPVPEDGATDGEAPPADAPKGSEAGSDAPRTDEGDTMEGAGETPSGAEPSPDDGTVDVSDADHAGEAADDGAAAPRTSDPTEGG